MPSHALLVAAARQEGQLSRGRRQRERTPSRLLSPTSPKRWGSVRGCICCADCRTRVLPAGSVPFPVKDPSSPEPQVRRQKEAAQKVIEERDRRNAELAAKEAAEASAKSSSKGCVPRTETPDELLSEQLVANGARGQVRALIRICTFFASQEASRGGGRRGGACEGCCAAATWPEVRRERPLVCCGYGRQSNASSLS